MIKLKKRRFPRTLHYRFYGWAWNLPELGLLNHWNWPLRRFGPSDAPRGARMARWQREAAIEYFATFMSRDEAERRYEANERGEAA